MSALAIYHSSRCIVSLALSQSRIGQDLISFSSAVTLAVIIHRARTSQGIVLNLRCTTINRECLTNHKACARTAEPRYGSGDLLRPPKSPNPYVFHQLLHSFGLTGQQTANIGVSMIPGTALMRRALLWWTVNLYLPKSGLPMRIVVAAQRCRKGWYRHITLAMLAHAALAVLRAQGEQNPGGQVPAQRAGVAPPAHAPALARLARRRQFSTTL
jgi:hypothetical protein